MSRLFTYIELKGETRLAGEANLNLRRGRLTSTFQYSPEYLGLNGAYAIDPAMKLTGGSWAVAHGLPRAFEDAAPDRWGRNLIAKRARMEAIETGNPIRRLDAGDYLLGVSDETRQGALRFKTKINDQFQHPSAEVPKLIQLPRLLRAAAAATYAQPDNLAAIKALLDAGTASLGGARPKASVTDGDRLFIAKFPHRNDEWPVIAWEKTALDLAELAGVNVSERQLLNVDGQAVLLLERFDRINQDRIGYISAMTLLAAEDGQSHDYIDIAAAIPEYSARTTADLRQLWRRAAFSIAINNTDDHLRNHGFLHEKAGWGLAPAFDLNPNPDPLAQRVTSIGGSTSPLSEVRALLIYAANFDLTTAKAKAILREVAQAVTTWPTVARRNGISNTQRYRFELVLQQRIEMVAAAGQTT